jgi:hypothetical protein
VHTRRRVDERGSAESTTMDEDLRSLILASRPSVVISEARASLLNPSRPSTPVMSGRCKVSVDKSARASSSLASATSSQGGSSPSSANVSSGSGGSKVRGSSSLRRTLYMSCDVRRDPSEEERKSGRRTPESVAAESPKAAIRHGASSSPCSLASSLSASGGAAVGIFGGAQTALLSPATSSTASATAAAVAAAAATATAVVARAAATKATTANAAAAAREAKVSDACAPSETPASPVGSARALLGENAAREALREVKDKITALASLRSSSPLEEALRELWPKVDQICALSARPGWALRSEAEALCRLGAEEVAACARSAGNMAVPDTGVVLALCRLCVRLAVGDRSGASERPLEETLELAYSIASEKAHDDAFRTERLIEAISMYLLPAPEQAAGQAAVAVAPRRLLVYALGSLKFVSMESEANQQALATCGAIGRLSALLHGLLSDDAGEEDDDGGAVRMQILIEATAVLRCVADDRRRLAQFVNNNIAALLCRALGRHTTDAELAFNCARILSKLSVAQRTRADIAPAPLLAALRAHYKSHPGVAVRLLFVLGNLTTSSNESRVAVARGDMQGAASSGLELLTRVLGHHARSYVEAGEPGARREREREDLLTKVVRVVANLAIDSELGADLLRRKGIRTLVPVLQSLVACPEGLTGKQEELALNIVACITNLSFYEAESEDEPAVLQEPATVELLLPFLFSHNAEAAAEAVRAFGNFSRAASMRKAMSSARVDEAICILADHTDRAVVLGACGVLTNLVGHAPTRAVLARLGTVDRLVTRLRRAGVSDLELSLRICMVLHNLGLGGGPAAIAPQQRCLLQRTLCELVDVALDMSEEGKQEHKLGDDEVDESGHDQARSCESFVQVAETLLNQIAGAGEET